MFLKPKMTTILWNIRRMSRILQCGRKSTNQQKLNELTFFQCSYCEPTKVCKSGSLIKKTLHKSCEGQEWMTEQCLGT